MEKEKRRSARLSSEGLFLVFLLLLLVGAILILCGRGSLAWFSSTTENRAGGMQLSVKGADISVAYFRAAPGEEEFSPLVHPEDMLKGLMPGESVRVLLVYTSHADADVTVSVKLSPREGDETPLEIDGRYYYLSTQLKVVERDEFLLTPPPDLVAYDAPVEPEETELGVVTVPAGGEATFTFTVTFLNYADVDQSEYQGFGTGDAGESCCRLILSEIEK